MHKRKQNVYKIKVTCFKLTFVHQSVILLKEVTFVKKYYTYTVKKIVTVQHLVTIEYLTIDPVFYHPKETHDFYEFVYVEKGEITCKTDDLGINLKENNFFLIPPETAHYYRAETGAEATVLVVCFKCKSNVLSAIKGICNLDSTTKSLIKKILSEAKSSFVFPFDKKLTLNNRPRIGSQQLIENYIEELLIKLFQNATYERDTVYVANTSDIKRSIAKEIKNILKGNIYSKISLHDISQSMLYSKTYLNDIFKELTGTTVMQYYQNLKIAEAKKLLCEGESVALISEKLCFESSQYFAKVFKRKTGLTPTEYKKSEHSDRNI